jgi:hypothetical protein
MPFFRDPNLDRDEEDQQGSGVQLSSGGMQAGPDGDPNKGSGASATKSGSRFTNLDSYLNNNDAKGFGQQFGQKIESGIDQAKANMDQAAGQVRSQIGAYSTPSEAQITGTIEKANKGAITDDDAKAYQGWANQKYEGPQGLADNQQAQGLYWGQADKAKTEANLAGKESGRFALLDQYFGRPSYNQGQKSLDNLLIQNGGGFNNQAQLQDKAASLVGYGNTQANQIRNEAQAKAGQIDQSRKTARSALGLQDDGSIKGGALGGFQDDLNARVKNYDERAAEAYQNSLADVSDDALEAVTAGGLGISDGTDLYDLDLAKYISQGSPAERGKIANESDYAKYQALSKLAGMDPTLLDPKNAGMAATQSNPNAAFNRDAFQRDLASRKSDYRNAINDYHRSKNFTEISGDVFDRGAPVSAYWEKYSPSARSVIDELKGIEQQYRVGRKANAPMPTAAGLPQVSGPWDPKAPAPTAQPGGEAFEPTTPLYEPTPPTTPAPGYSTQAEAAAAAPINSGAALNGYTPTYAATPDVGSSSGYEYEGHEWDDPDLMSMFDFERLNADGTPKLKAR